MSKKILNLLSSRFCNNSELNTTFLYIQDPEIRKKFNDLRDQNFGRFRYICCILVIFATLRFVAYGLDTSTVSFSMIRLFMTVIWLIVWFILNSKCKSLAHYTIYIIKLGLLGSFVPEVRGQLTSEIADINSIIDILYLSIIISSSVVNYNEFFVNLLVDPVLNLLPYYFLCIGQSLNQEEESDNLILRKMTTMLVIVVFIQISAYIRIYDLATGVISQHKL